MKKIIDSSDSDLNERIRLAQTEDSLTALEDDVRDLSVKLDKLELEPVITLTVDGLNIKVEPHWIKNKYPLSEIIEAAVHHDSVDKTEKYLRNKYSPMSGVPHEHIADETGLEHAQIYNWLGELGLLRQGQHMKQVTPFIDFEIAAQMAVVGL